MKQLIITLICLLMQVVNIHATSEGITWKWDYSDAKDTFIDLTDKYSTGFVETNTPNYYGGKLIVELPEELYFRQTGVPIFLFTGNIDERESQRSRSHAFIKNPFDTNRSEASYPYSTKPESNQR